MNTTSGMNSEQRLNHLLNAQLDLAIFFLSPTGFIESWNRAVEKLVGYSANDVIGKHLSLFYTPEDRDSKLVDRELEQAARTGRYEGCGWRVRKDGSRFWADIIITAMRDEQGKINGFLKILRDGSERKKTEDMLERQRQDLIELSTPVMQLWEGILVLPLIGTVDSQRSQIVMEKLLSAIMQSGSAIAILDISGVSTVDTMVAQHLMKTMEAAKLMGAECIISGIRPEIAQTMVHLGVDLTTVRTKSNMSRALKEAIAMMESIKQ